MDSDDYSSDEPDEIVHLQNVNDQLHADLERLQNQFNDMLDSYPKIEEVNKENNLLKKKLVDANIQIEDYKRRLNLSQNTNISQKRKLQNDQTKENRELLTQISQLKAKISDMNDLQQQKNDEFFMQMKKSEKNLKKIEQEKNLLNTQLSNIVTLSTNYFRIHFNDAQALCDFLLHPQPFISNNELNDNQQKLQEALLNQEKEDKKKSDENRFKKLYNDEKMKRKKLELDLLKLKKTQETKHVNKEQQQELLTDLEIKYQNELRQIETNYKKEIQELKTKEITVPSSKSYKTAESQIDLTSDNQINTEVINDDDDDIESIQKVDSNQKNVNNEKVQIHANQNPPQQQQQQQPINRINPIDEANHFKEQTENLIDLLRKSEEKILKLRTKQKQCILTNRKLRKFIIKAKRKNSMLKEKIEEYEAMNTKINENVNQEQQSVSPIDIKNKVEELKSLKNSMKLIQELTTNQAADIQQLMSDRDKLLNILLLQNQYIYNSEGVIQRLQQKNEKQNQLLNSSEVPKNNNEKAEKEENVVENINWQLDNFPQSIVSLTKPIAENDCLPIKARIRHVMSIMSKWATNLDSNYNKMMVQNDENVNELNKKYDNLLSNVLVALGEQNDNANEKEVLEKVTELSNNNLILQQKNNELESITQKEEQKSVNQVPTTENLNKLHEALKDTKESLKRKTIELKECKNAFLQCQQSSHVEIEALRESNSRVRNELNNLQTNYNNLNDQYTLLLSQIDQLKNSHQEELAEKENEIERLQSRNSNQFRDMQKQTQKSIKSKDQEIETLQSQLDDANKTIETFQESTRMTIEDINQSKVKLEKYKNKNKEQLNAIKQKEKKFAEIEKYYVNTIKNLQEQNKVLREDNRVQEASDKLRQAEEMISQLETKVIKLNYQIQQDSMKSKSEIDQLERNNKLLIVQNKAKLMSVETDCSIKCDQLKTIYETEKKDFLCYIVQNFKQFFDLRNEMNEDSIKSAIVKIKNELTFLRNLENSIRKLTNAQEGQSTEDALTDLIISMHPQLK